MRVTLRIDEKLRAEAKAAAAELGLTQGKFVEHALRQWLERRATSRRQRVVLPTFGCGGLLPGVDINNSAALLDIMEGIEPTEPRP